MDRPSEKLQIVVESLSNNPAVVIAGGYENTFLNKLPARAEGDEYHQLEIFTYPKEPIYTAQELNDFMSRLVPELKPTAYTSFHDSKSYTTFLDIGLFSFLEKIGTADLSAAIHLTKGFILEQAGVSDSDKPKPKTIDLLQRTRVFVYPDAGHVSDAAEDYNKYDIPTSELGIRPVTPAIEKLLHSPLLNKIIQAKG